MAENKGKQAKGSNSTRAARRMRSWGRLAAKKLRHVMRVNGPQEAQTWAEKNGQMGIFREMMTKREHGHGPSCLPDRTARRSM